MSAKVKVTIGEVECVYRCTYPLARAIDVILHHNDSAEEVETQTIQIAKSDGWLTVGELKEKLKDIPDDLHVLAEGEEADKVIIEECQGNKYVRIFRSWDVEFTGRFENEDQE